METEKEGSDPWSDGAVQATLCGLAGAVLPSFVLVVIHPTSPMKVQFFIMMCAFFGGVAGLFATTYDQPRNSIALDDDGLGEPIRDVEANHLEDR